MQTKFKNAQEARTTLMRQGWEPLTKISFAEHFVRGNRRCVLLYEGDEPETAGLLGCSHVAFYSAGDLIIAESV